MCPAIDEIITVDRIRMRDGHVWTAVGSMFGLVRDLRRRKFDVAIDFHGFRETSLLAWWSGAPVRWGLKRFDQSFFGFCFNRPPIVEDKSLHASEPFMAIARSVAPGSIPGKLPPSLVIPSDALQWATESLPSSPFVALFIDAPVPERIWPLERFADLANHIVTTLRCSVVVLGNTRHSFGDRVKILSDLSIPRLAAVISRARMLVSNDTGPMHLGPALGIPTIGIFSVGIPRHFRPTGATDQYVQGNPIEEVGLAEVIKATNQVWELTGRRDPQC
jgi:ADP-heptose:LPS heptosyltransferase